MVKINKKIAKSSVKKAQVGDSIRSNKINPTISVPQRELDATVARHEAFNRKFEEDSKRPKLPPLTAAEKKQQYVADSTAFANKKPLVDLFPGRRKTGGKVSKAKSGKTVKKK